MMIFVIRALSHLRGIVCIHSIYREVIKWEGKCKIQFNYVLQKLISEEWFDEVRFTAHRNTVQLTFMFDMHLPSTGEMKILFLVYTRLILRCTIFNLTASLNKYLIKLFSDFSPYFRAPCCLCITNTHTTHTLNMPHHQNYKPYCSLRGAVWKRNLSVCIFSSHFFLFASFCHMHGKLRGTQFATQYFIKLPNE